MNEIIAVARDSQGPEDTPEKLEEERLAAQHFIDTGMCVISLDISCALIYCSSSHFGLVLAEPLTPEELQLKDELTEQGFPEWSRRDFQQFIRGLEAHGWYVFSACLIIVFW